MLKRLKSLLRINPKKPELDVSLKAQEQRLNKIYEELDEIRFVLAGMDFEDVFLTQIKDFGKKSEFALGSLLGTVRLAIEQKKINAVRKFYEQKKDRERIDNSATASLAEADLPRD